MQSFRFLTAKKIPGVSHHTNRNLQRTATKESNAVRLSNEMNTERFCEFDARTKSII